MRSVVIGLIVSAVLVVSVGLVFALARRLDLTLGEIYLRLFAAALAINVVCVLCWNPALIARRIGFGAGWKDWDIAWMVVNAPVMLAVFGVAIEVRDSVSGEPGAAWLLGLAIFIPGWALITWAMVANPFFEKIVRIQTDQGHHVVDTGPYTLVRHPGYVGFSAWMLSTPLLFGSSWAFVPAVLAVVGFVYQVRRPLRWWIVDIDRIPAR